MTEIEQKTKEHWDNLAMPIVIEAIVVLFGIFEGKLWLIAMGVVAVCFAIYITKRRVDKLKVKDE